VSRRKDSRRTSPTLGTAGEHCNISAEDEDEEDDDDDDEEELEDVGRVDFFGFGFAFAVDEFLPFTISKLRM
jgi:hypothetical protein